MRIEAVGIRQIGSERRIFPTSYFLLPTSYFLLPTSYFLLPTSYFLLPTSYFLLPGVGVDEADDLRGDLVAEARAVEDTIVTDPRLQMVQPHGRRQGAAEIVGGLGLA